MVKQRFPSFNEGSADHNWTKIALLTIRLLPIFLFSFLAFAAWAQDTEELSQLKSKIQSATGLSKAEAYYAVAEYYSGRSKYSESSPYLDSALLQFYNTLAVTEATLPSEFEDKSTAILLAKLLILNGRLQSVEGDYFTAFESLEKAPSYFPMDDSTFSKYYYSYHHALSFNYFYLSDYPRYFETLYEGLDQSEKLQDEFFISKFYNLMGIGYIELGNYELARVSLDRARHFAIRSNNSRTLNSTSFNMGLIHCRYTKQYDSAILLFKSHVEGVKKANREWRLTYSYNGLGDAYGKMKEYATALGYFKEALKYATEYQMDYEMAWIYNNMGSLLLDAGREVEAVTAWMEAAKIANERGHKNKEMEASEQLYNYYYEAGDFKNAFEYLSTYAMLKDSIGDKEKRREIDNLRIGYQLEQRTREADLLKTENELMDTKLRATGLQIRNQNILLVTVSLILIFLIVFAIVLVRYLKRRNREKFELMELNGTIIEQQTAIQQRNEELNATLDELRSTQDRLVQSEKMASLGILIAGIGHEINNPLNFINQSMMALNMKLKRGIIDPKKDEIKEFDGIAEGIKRIANIVNSLRRFSRDSKVMNEACNTVDILKGCLEIVQSKIKKSELKIKEVYPEEGPILSGNEGKLHQAFLNFISNAIDASHPGGTITITVLKEESHVIVEIKDEGAGMDEEVQKNLGNPFFTTKEPGKGTGLGIYISKDIIEAHHGRVSYESESEVGTTVRVQLPFQH